MVRYCADLNSVAGLGDSASAQLIAGLRLHLITALARILIVRRLQHLAFDNAIIERFDCRDGATNDHKRDFDPVHRKRD